MADMKCVKVEPKDHLSAYLENRELVRYVDSLECDPSLIESVISNYIIVKTILSHLPWQDQMVCKLVCRMWCDAIKTLQKEFLAPQDYVVVLSERTNKIKLKKSGSLPTEPLALFTFANFAGFSRQAECKYMKLCPCDPVCDNKHLILDCIDLEFCYPKECMMIVEAADLAYMPLTNAVTAPHTFTKEDLHTNISYLCGVYIPKLLDVQYDVLNIKGNTEMTKEFYDVVNKIADTRIFKGFLVLVTDKYLLNSLDDMVFLNHFKKIQPTIPYAMGGCIVEDTLSERSDLVYFVNSLSNNDASRFVSENVISICMFSVPKDENGMPSCRSNFNMYSLVIEQNDWSKPKIQKIVKEFADSVPQFEHSLAFKLTCVGRDHRHDFEQDTFRSCFPNTPLIGCYGNGELGLNYPPRPEPKAPLNSVKRLKKDSSQFGIMYSYSTIMVYCGWGKTKN